MHIIIGAAAKRELEDGVAWYEVQLPGLGKRFAQEIHATVSRVVRFPRAYGELDKGIRRALVKTFPYGVVYAERSGLRGKPGLDRNHRDRPPASTPSILAGAALIIRSASDLI